MNNENKAKVFLTRFYGVPSKNDPDLSPLMPFDKIIQDKKWIDPKTTDEQKRVVFSELEHSSQFWWIFYMMLNHVEIPSFLRHISVAKRMVDMFSPLIWCPQSFRIAPLEGKAKDRTKWSVTLDQYAILHDLLRPFTKVLRTPFGNAPAVYWYFFTSIRAGPLEMKEYILARKFDLHEVEDEKLIEILPAFEMDEVWQKLNPNMGEQFIRNCEMIGDVNYPEFVPRTRDFSLDEETYQTAPEYWNFILKFDHNNVFYNAVRKGIQLCLVRSVEEPPFLQEELIPVQRYELIPEKEGEEGEEHVKAIQVTVGVSSYDMPVLDPIVSLYKKEVVIRTCQCNHCGPSYLSDAMKLYHPRDWYKALGQYQVVVPVDFDLMKTLEKGVVLNSIDFQNAPEVGFKRSETIWADETLFRQYLHIETAIARKVNFKFYDLILHDRHPGYILEMSQSHWNRGLEKSGRKLIPFPRTFYKFYWLFRAEGVIWRRYDGAPQLGQNPPLGFKRIFEMSAAPYGCLASLIETGTISQGVYTKYPGEAAMDCPYDSLYNPDTGQGTYQLLTDNAKGLADIDTLPPLLLKMAMAHPEKKGKYRVCFQNDTNIEKGFESGERFGMVICDIPLTRNSIQYYKLAALNKEREQKKMGEHVDDVPLARSQATKQLIRKAAMLCDAILAEGGSFVLKIIEPWEKEIVEILYTEMLKNFQEYRVYLTPFTKTLGKEVYVVMRRYQPEREIEVNEWQNGLNKAFSLFFRLNNIIIAKLTCSMIVLAQKHGRTHVGNRQVGCRSSLVMRNKLGPVPTEVWKHSEGPLIIKME